VIIAKQKQTYGRKKTLRLEVVGCCGTDTDTRKAQAFGNSRTVTDMSVSHYTQTGTDHYQHIKT